MTLDARHVTFGYRAGAAVLRDVSVELPGGSVTAMLAVYDTMQLITAPVSTTGIGLTASFGTVLLTAGAKGRRYATENTTIHMHQPLGGAQGQASDIVIQANEIVRLRQRNADGGDRPATVRDRARH